MTSRSAGASTDTITRGCYLLSRGNPTCPLSHLPLHKYSWAQPSTPHSNPRGSGSMQSNSWHWTGALLCFLGLLAASWGRVLPPSPDWQRCKNFSSQVNKLAWDIKGHVSLLSLVEENPSEDLTPQIRCSDKCNPDKLGSEQKCLDRIHEALTHYRALLGSEVFTELKGPDTQLVAALRSALAQLTSLVQDGSLAPEPPTIPPQQSQPWERPLLQHRILQQLRSFSAVMARVFAHGAATR